MLQGTGSGVGKSILVTALCRIFLQDGYRVAPFKAQNMALNSSVTRDGGEMGRAQVVQAQACRVEPSVDMNPILIKPTSDLGAQIIVRGAPVGNMSVLGYTSYKKQTTQVVAESFRKLIHAYDIVVIEGAGSPAEVNLKEHDIVNMHVAEISDSPVVLVGDIDKGGVFAWLVGTMELLTKEERARVKGFIINKFRGDRTLLKPGIEFLEKRTGKKVLGVVPYFRDIRIPEEDSVADYQPKRSKATLDEVIRIAVIRLPHMSNFTDFHALQDEPDVDLRYVEYGEDMYDPDAIILPGTKSTVSDLEYLYTYGYADRIKKAAYQDKVVVGICGGYQMLGERILDPLHVEHHRSEIQGLGLLNTITEFDPNKLTAQVKARELKTGMVVEGYEIHQGKTRLLDGAPAAFDIMERSGQPVNAKDGASSCEGSVWGTNIHGLFDNNHFRRHFIDRIRIKKGWSPRVEHATVFNQDKEYDKLAELARLSLDLNSIYQILWKEVPHD